MGKKLTLSIDEAVIAAAKEYVEKQGISLSSYVESLLKNTTGEISNKTPKKPASKTPLTDELEKIIENNQRTKEEMEAYEEELYDRKPYMKEIMEHYNKKFGYE